MPPSEATSQYAPPVSACTPTCACPVGADDISCFGTPEGQCAVSHTGARPSAGAAAEAVRPTDAKQETTEAMITFRPNFPWRGPVAFECESTVWSAGRTRHETVRRLFAGFSTEVPPLPQIEGWSRGKRSTSSAASPQAPIGAACFQPRPFASERSRPPGRTSGENGAGAGFLRGSRGPQTTPGPRLGDVCVVPSEQVAQHGVGVLAHRRGTGGCRQLLADELDGSRQLLCAQLFRSEPVEAILELGVLGDGPRRVDGADREVGGHPEVDPLLGRSGAEDVPQLASQLEVVAGVVGELGARPPLEQVHAADCLAEVPPEGLLGGHEQHIPPVLGLVDLIAHAID